MSMFSSIWFCTAAVLPLAFGAAEDPLPIRPGVAGTVAIKVGKAETISAGVIEHAVILIENGVITAVGEDLPIERGIPVLDRPEWVALPGLVNPYSRMGFESRSGNTETNPELSPLPELLPRHRDYSRLLEAGVTTLGIYPPGLGIPGQAIALRPRGSTQAEMLVDDSTYLKIYFRSDARSKKAVRDAWTKVDEYDEKVKKAREKWEKDAEKAKSSKKPADKKEEPKKDDAKKDEAKKDDAKKDEPKPEDKPEEKPDEKKGDKKDEEASKTFVPPPPDPKLKPFLDLRDGKLSALVSIGQSADWLHWLDALGERKFEWDLRVPVSRELDLFEVTKVIGEKKVRVVMEPQLSLHPGTMRQRNIPAELSRAGAKLVLIPRFDTLRDHERWLWNVGEMVGAGLEREVALRAVTLEGASVLGLEDKLGSIEKGKTANLVFFDGDPLEVGTKVRAVMLEGSFVVGEVRQ